MFAATLYEGVIKRSECRISGGGGGKINIIRMKTRTSSYKKLCCYYIKLTTQHIYVCLLAIYSFHSLTDSPPFLHINFGKKK